MLTRRGLAIVIALLLFVFLWVTVWFFFFRHKEKVLEEIRVDTPSGQLTVFAGKGEANKVIGTVNQGEKLQVLEKSDNWYKVQLPNGEVGYINSALLRRASPTEVAKSQPGQPSSSGQPGQPTSTSGDEKVIGEAYVNIRSGHLNVREGRGTNSRIIATLLKGEKVQLLEDEESKKNTSKTQDPKATWHKVRLPNGVVGYVRGDYLKTTPP